ncbi:hypothetical protein B0T25DRAFT_231471 [Lasiosphaeria hispida]|uniref:Uncharacterized protein n=1 Tax=Lasiosphaeria hispida TaxID=260671 RepID=A0AAJ0HE12_9PEZI|nr:hypothetical protein B0T25DRAFT_231471 [Lasiosphaeria hispida]
MHPQYTEMSSSGSSFEDERQDKEDTPGSPQQQLTIHAWRFPTAASLVIVLLTLNAIGLGFIFASVTSYRRNGHGACQGRETHLSTEFQSFPTLSEELVKYTGGLAFTAPGKMYRTGIEGLPRYVGEASDEVDDNWELLVDVQPVNITREEALQSGGEFYYFPGTDIAQIEVSFTHMLHCLNFVRRAVYWKHYWPKGISELDQIHTGGKKTTASMSCDNTSNATSISRLSMSSGQKKRAAPT